MHDSLPSLRALRVFLSVAQTGSISRSAESLFRAPSALTRSIRELELSLGVDLFERRSRGMLPTAFGELVLNRTELIQHELHRAWDELLPMRSGPKGPDQWGAMSALFNRKRLSLFLAVVDLRHLPTVAASHGISQPAVSSSIKALEQVLRVSLFDRTIKGLVPTNAGNALAARVRHVIATLKLIRQELAALQGGIQGLVTVGALPLGRTTVLPTAIARLISKYPSLQIRTVESPYESLVTELRNGELDFILGALRPLGDSTDLACESLFTDVISVLVRRDHPLTRKHRLRVEDLLGAKWVLSRARSPTNDLIHSAFEALGHQAPTPVVETGDLAVLRGLLLESDVITAISAHQLHYEIEDGSLTVLDFQLSRTDRAIGITLRAGAQPSPAAAALIAEVRSVAQSIRWRAPIQYRQTEQSAAPLCSSPIELA